MVYRIDSSLYCVNVGPADVMVLVLEHEFCQQRSWQASVVSRDLALPVREGGEAGEYSSRRVAVLAL